MHNKGKAQYRFDNNPVEKIFAELWEKENLSIYGKSNGSGILDYLLANNPNRPDGEVAERDREVAATVIQWLGSPCGQGFIRKAQSKCEDQNITYSF